MIRSTGKLEVDRALGDLERKVDQVERSISDRVMYMFGGATIATGATDVYLFPFRPTGAPTSDEIQVQVLRDGILRNASLLVPTPGTAAADRKIELVLRVNSKDTPMKIQWTLPRFTGVLYCKGDPEIAVKRGDLLSVVIRKSGTLTGSPTDVIYLVELS